MKKKSLQRTSMILSDLKLVEDSVCFPPPVMLSLCELSLSVVAVQVRVVGIYALNFLRPELPSKQHLH
jgi:hypothetical protein